MLRTINPNGIPPGKAGLPFQMFRCSRTFSGEPPKTVVFHSLPNRIFLKRFANGKQPYPPYRGSEIFTEKGRSCLRMLSFSSLNLRSS